MVLRHTMGPVRVEPARRPHDWAVYSFMAATECTRCRQMITMELMLPDRLMALIPNEKRDEAMRVMSAFAEKRMEYYRELANDPTRQPDDPEPLLCKERKR